MQGRPVRYSEKYFLDDLETTLDSLRSNLYFFTLICHYGNHLKPIALTKMVLLTLGALTIAASSFGSKQLEMTQPLERKNCLDCKTITNSKGISRNYNSMRRSMLDGAHPIGITRTYNSMRKTMLDGANLKSNMTEAVACKPRRYNAHKPLQVCP